MRLLLVEDDPMIGQAVLDALRAEHYAVDWVRDGEMADGAAQRRLRPHAARPGLPRRDGLQVLRELRARRSTLPVLVATARDAVSDRVAGLDAGADDYVVKPFDTDELLARVRALLAGRPGRPAVRAAWCQPQSRHPRGPPPWPAGGLSAREWAVLEPLIARPGVIFSRAQLEEKLFSWKEDISSNAVEVYIHGVRKKLGAGLIQTVRGLGYLVPRE
jgi:two-component system OmpR family response regulator